MAARLNSPEVFSGSDCPTSTSSSSTTRCVAEGALSLPELFGREYTRSELNQRVGRLDQVAGVSPIEFDDGRARGVRAFDVRSGGGLRFTSVADRALDVCSLEFRGIPLVWHGPGGVAAPAYYEPTDDSFDRNFFGGLLTTCGLNNFGPAGHDTHGNFGVHGRVNHLPAENLATRTVWEGDRCTFEISGTISEAQMFGEDLSLHRTLCVELGANRLRMHDVVENHGGMRRPHMLLYHCNMGFPLLDAGSQLEVTHRSMRPRDEQAARGMDDWNRGGTPDPLFAEQVFVHEPLACADGYARAIMLNRSLDGGRGMALAIAYDPIALPALFTWRMLGVKTCVMGIEPANCPTIEGRIEAGKRGTLPFLEPGERRRYDLQFEVLGGAAAIDRELDMLYQAR
ncbi:MAG TPA: aldose 1-epimerase family protein [Candidatus Tumulicola sp.]